MAVPQIGVTGYASLRRPGKTLDIVVNRHHIDSCSWLVHGLFHGRITAFSWGFSWQNLPKQPRLKAKF